MISKQLKFLFFLSLILIAAHGVEEFNTNFLYVDETNRFFANLFATKEEVFYWAFHIMWWLMLIVVYLVIMGGKWALIPLTLFGIVYVFEIHHLYKAFQTGGYYPGMLTAIFYPIMGIFYWKELIKNWSKI
jgi:hypothetical protein